MVYRLQSKTKTSRPQIMGREGEFSRYHPNTICADIHRLPGNAWVASQTTDVQTCNVLTRETQEGTSTDFGRVQFQRFLCTSLAASASLLSSVTAFDLIAVIICRIKGMSRLAPKYKKGSTDQPLPFEFRLLNLGEFISLRTADRTIVRRLAELNVPTDRTKIEVNFR